MKKTIIVLVLLFAALGLFAQNSRPGFMTGVIREISGTVEIKAPGVLEFVPAAEGTSVSQDTIISTGFRSTALVELGSTLIAVRPLTRLSLTEISAAEGTETLNVNLQAGRVRVDVNPPAGTRTAMSVTGPNATASVRGTSFSFDGKVTSVIKGAVLVEGTQGAPVMVGGGYASTVGATGRMQTPVFTGGRGDDNGLFPKRPGEGGGGSVETPSVNRPPSGGAIFDFDVEVEVVY